MAQNTRPTFHFGDQTVETLDEPAGGPELLAYGSTPSMAKRDYFLPEGTPLFLSSDAAEPQYRSLGSGGARNPSGAVVRSKFIMAAIFAAFAAAVTVAVLSVENPLSLFANAKASLIGVQSNDTAKSPLERGAAARPATAQPAPATPSAVSLATLPTPAEAAPTRDQIALALRAAHQSQQQIHPPAVASAPARRLDADELTTLLKRARGLIAIGDIAAARLLLERAADAQEASAALLLAQTWDPAVLGTPDARSITPDPAKARDWYQKAARFGSPEAQLRLSQMQN